MMVAGCGRIDFAPAGPDAAPPEASSDCTASPFRAPVLIAELVGPGTDATLTLQANELAGAFWSGRDGNIDLFAVTRPEMAAPFTVSALTALDSPNFDFDPSVSADGTSVVFASNRAGGAGGLDLYAGALPAGPAQLIAGVSSTADDQQAFTTADGTELYFASNRTGPFELYHSASTSPGMYAPPMPVAGIAVGNENNNDPVLALDGLAIFFRSDRDGLGNIFTATRATRFDAFGTATKISNLSVDGSVAGPNWLSHDGCRLYLSSDRTGTPHVYVATRP